MTTAIIFGRFRILHAGHYALIRYACRTYDNVTVGVSNSSASQRSIELLRSRFGDRITIISASNPFDLLSQFSDLENTTFLAGADRQNMLERLTNYFPQLLIRLIPRSSEDPSSSACRELLENGCNGEDLLDAGLAENREHALQIIAQYALENV
jgi:cytidyltransferase-like protein